MVQTGQQRPRFSRSVGAGVRFERRGHRRSISRAMSIGYAWLTVVFLCKAGAQPVSLPSAPGSKADDVPKMCNLEPNTHLFQLNLAKISDSYRAKSPVNAG